MLEHHRKVLEALDELTYPFGERCVSFKPLCEKTEMSFREVRRITRHLARHGKAEYFRALMTEDGDFAGAGYCITTEGRTNLQQSGGPDA